MAAKVRSQQFVKRSVVAARRLLLPSLRLAAPRRHTDADPFRLIDVPAERITHMQRRWRGSLDLPWLETGRFGRHASLLRRWHCGAVLDGDWDLAVEPFDEYHLTRVFHERFVQGKRWEDIHYVKRSLRTIAAGRSAWGGRCRTVEEVQARCRYLDDLHTSLATEGFASEPSGASDFTHFVVNIGRDGTIIRNNDGKHRIVLAKLLGIERLPARVFIRHRRWQAVRDAIRRGDAVEVLDLSGPHPDLVDLLGAG